MLDIKFIIENKDIVKTAIKNKKKDVDVEETVRLFEQRKVLRQKLDDLNAKKNDAQKNRDVELGKSLKVEYEKVEEQFKEIDKKYIALMLSFPNIPSADTPVGPDESANVVIRQWGEKPSFSFKPKEHFEIGADLGVIDSETAGAVSGSRFTYLKGDLALMQFALIQMSLDILTSLPKLQEIAKSAGLKSEITKTFIPVIPPVFIKPAVQNRMARFISPSDHFMFPEDDLMLIGSAEHTLGAMHMDEIFAEKELPIRYVGYSTAFRREAGTYGKDTRGILRQHQFDKLEMEVFSLPENSLEEQNFLVAIQENILQKLKLPYQVVSVCTGDMGGPDYRQIDIETWMPGQDRYRETHSSDNTTGFQARRLNTRVKREEGKMEPVHMNDATVVAIGRTLIAIIENYQNEDGTVTIPEVLRPFMGGREKISKIESFA